MPMGQHSSQKARNDLGGERGEATCPNALSSWLQTEDYAHLSVGGDQVGNPLSHTSGGTARVGSIAGCFTLQNRGCQISLHSGAGAVPMTRTTVPGTRPAPHCGSWVWQGEN